MFQRWDFFGFFRWSDKSYFVLLLHKSHLHFDAANFDLRPHHLRMNRPISHTFLRSTSMTVGFHSWQKYLSPADLGRSDIEWLGMLIRASGARGALGRVRATGLLMQVNRGVFQTLEQHQAETALTAATLEVARSAESA
jgi:hypothetical protein